MKAKTFSIILLAVLALTPLTPPVHGGTAGGLATASVGAGQTHLLSRPLPSPAVRERGRG
jgi:hypothetical protein